MGDHAVPNNAIHAGKPAEEWAMGYPIGNGRIGAMITGCVQNERIALNHDLLWRRFMAWQGKKSAALLPEVRRLCAEGKWDEAQNLFLTRIPETGNALYINPFVPFCDLGLFLHHRGEGVSGYRRTLDMDAGVASVEYAIDGRRYRRECFCSFGAGLFFLRLSCSVAGCLSGEVSLSRLLDPDCAVTGSSALGNVTLLGKFEEGVTFAASARVFQRGGRLTSGIRAYAPPAGDMPGKDLGGIAFLFRDESQAFAPCGVSTCFDSADEVFVAVALATDDESGMNPAELCEQKLSALGEGFPDVDALLQAHAEDNRSLYCRTGLTIAGGDEGQDVEALLERVALGQRADNALYGLLYNMGRYLAIAAGRPQPRGAAPKSPINLQGIWNQDRRPAWDCDFHLDLNVQMCYWGLDAMNLGELMQPLMDWVTRLMPQGRSAAMDLYGCRGVCFPAPCDNKVLGTPDNIGYCFTSAAAWLAQILWQHYSYSKDLAFLRDGLYPFLNEVAAFYDDFLVKDGQGYLTACPSCSPEMGIAGRDRWSVLSSTSTIDMELIRELYSHLCEAARLLGVDMERQNSWSEKLKWLPLPPITPACGIGEWLQPHEPYDAGHRHRSHLVGMLPGDRITVEDTPEYAQAVRCALEVRHSRGLDSSLAWTTAMDAMAYARLYDAESALGQLDETIYYNVMDNLLLTTCDWRNRGETLTWFSGHRLFQMEAGLCLACAIGEMAVQDRRGVIRLLAALPASWPDGDAFGIRARRGFEVSVRWAGGRLKSARILSTLGGICRVLPFCAPGGVSVRCCGREVHTDVQGNIVAFDTAQGLLYDIMPVNG